MQPSYTNNFEFKHTYNDLLTSSISLELTNNGFNQLMTNDINDMHRFTWENYFKRTYIGVTESVNYNIFPWWSTSSTLSVAYVLNKTDYEGIEPRYHFVWAYFKSTHSFSFNPAKLS